MARGDMPMTAVPALNSPRSLRITTAGLRFER